MAIQDKITRTISCEAPECTNTVTFDPQSAEDVGGLEKNASWLRTARTVQLGNKQQFFYCSDVCEVKGVTTGKHNIPEPPKIQPAVSEAQIRQAAADAQAAAEANTALKNGSIQLTDN